ncbi:phospholipase D-like domain-containing protein [Pseudomonas coleopterorum]|uniref:Phospholipase D-like domain-containing protein n=1 Tax=Pseudomonas coleopterorum TaxID=1605838 RepID=A0AAJ6LXY8_9PSED|nr:phospholipase D-like domain-containing protein [Pseudomonas coleopterorum]WNC08811.1 phospholipase D-like domain-containing protein [Pseudomonas coleopterorum]
MDDTIYNSKKIFVKVPFGYGIYRFKILRSQHWGAVDLLILQALASTPSSSHTLARRSGLPRQLIVEILIPLMRAGWIEIVNSDSEFLFRISDRGRAVSGGDDLPANQEPMSHVRSFLIDPITEQCYRLDRKKKRQTFQVYKAGKAKSLLAQYGDYAAEVIVKSPRLSPALQDIFDCVAYDSEDIVGFEDDYIKLSYNDSMRYIIACVDPDGQVSGAPDVSNELKDAILSAAKKQRDRLSLLGTGKKSEGSAPESYEADTAAKSFQTHVIDQGQIFLISGAEAHGSHLGDLIRAAKTRLIIHSTFINIECLEALFKELLDASRRSVQIDILWGQTEPESTEKVQDYNRLIRAIDDFQKRIDTQGLSTQFRFHKSPTNSHSKFIICDNADAQWGVTIGSCNWLSSRFNRFETSVNIKHPKIVSEVLSIASTLAVGRHGVANALSRDLAIASSRIAKLPVHVSCESIKKLIKVRIITAPEHHSLVKHASDTAMREIFVCSHRISFAGDRPILTPLLAAKKEIPALAIRIAYGRPSGAMKNREANDVKSSLEEAGLEVVKADDPQIHAKFACWDERDLVVSSLNWLSASSKGEEFSELGVHLQGGPFSTMLRKSFDDFYDI